MMHISRNNRLVTGSAAPSEASAPFFSYRQEEPDCLLYLKIVPWDEGGGSMGHSHDFVELVYVRAGSGFHVHAGQKYPVYAGDCFVVLPYEPHHFLSNRVLGVYNIIFYPEVLEPDETALLAVPGFSQLFSIEPLFRQETSFRYKLHLGVSQQKRFLLLCDELIAELAAKEPGYIVSARASFLRLVVFLSRCYSSTIDTSTMRKEFSGKQQMIAEAIAYLEQNHARDVRVDDVARSVFISPSRLQHVFKDATGLSLVDYLAQMRIDRAMEMLREGDKGLNEIALSLGFHDPSYFGRLFKRMTGTTPAGYRRQSRASEAGRPAV
jgi:AraC-like DNA-binding protein